MGDLQKWLNMKWKQEQYRMSEPKKVTRQDIIDTLTQAAHMIEFTKVDGSNRRMCATLVPDQLPPQQTQEGVGSLVNKTKDSVAVWDMDVQGWRSFRLENLIMLGTDMVKYAGK